MQANTFLKSIALITMSLGLTACGGGGSDSTGGNTTPPTTTPPTTPPPTDGTPLIDRLTIMAPQNAQTGQAIGLAAVLSSGAEIVSSNWTQTAGPTTTVLANNSQVIGFDVTEAGDYTFTYQATDASNETTEQEVSFSVSEASQPNIAQVRLDHAVTENGNVSLRADTNNPNQTFSVSWQQISGPTIAQSDLTLQDALLFFRAPSVTQDELLEFRATLSYPDGSTDTDTAYVLIKNTNINNSGFFPDAADRIVSEDVYAYRASSPHASDLVDCVYNNQINQSCTFGRLPLLGQETNNPTINDVMNRVVVSHDWMGERFQEYLQSSPVSADMLQLFKGVTAVVISADVRPSFYWSATGAIYLDPANFWVTPQERDTLNDVPDFRSNFGTELQFIFPWRYVENNESYLNRVSYPAEQRLQRTTADVQADITWLLFHELAHANDFLPPSSHATLSNSTSPLQFSQNNTISSSTMTNNFPLASNELKSLAQVSFAGTASNTTQQNYSANEIETFFTPDAAAMYYSYFTEREDYATIFERFMMAYRLDVYGDVAVISRNNNPNFNVQWGQRNRIAEPQFRDRTRFIVNSIFPNIDVDAAINNMPAAQNMIRNVSWFDNLDLSTNGSAQRAQGSQPPDMLVRPRSEADLRLHIHDSHWHRPEDIPAKQQ